MLTTCRYIVLVIFFCFGNTVNLKAQQYFQSSISQYFRNGYLWNPAFAGSKDHPSIFVHTGTSWIGFEDAPKLNIFTADMAFGKNSGAGFRFSSDRSGLLQRTSADADYSFTMKFNETEQLRLGIAVGVFLERFNNTSNVIDPILPGFNNKPPLFDGSFGALYKQKKLTIGATIYNIRSSFNDKNVPLSDLIKSNVVITYDVLTHEDNEITLTALASHKSFSITEPLVTTGLQFDYRKIMRMALLYENTASILGSIGFSVPSIGEFNLSYASPNKYGYAKRVEIGVGIIIK